MSQNAMTPFDGRGWDEVKGGREYNNIKDYREWFSGSIHQELLHTIVNHPRKKDRVCARDLPTLERRASSRVLINYIRSRREERRSLHS